MTVAPRRMKPLRGPFDADVVVPGSKSYTNRALICAALANGTSILRGALASDDTAAMFDCLSALGIAVRSDHDGQTLTVTGCGGQLPRATAELGCRLSGTTARFIAPLACLGAGPYRVFGGAPLQARPMADQFRALRSLGAAVDASASAQADHLPVVIRGAGFAGGSVEVAGNVSSQFLSGLLLIGAATTKGIDVRVTTELVSRSYVELTLDTIRAFGGQTTATADRFAVAPGGYVAREYDVEPDASAASYFFAAAAVTGGRTIVRGLHRTSIQGDTSFVDILARMGCAVTDTPAGIEVVGPTQLRGIEVDMADCSDVAQTLAAIAPFASSPTRITGIGFIRRKETDRIAAMVTELRRCGIAADEEPDGVLIRPGTPKPAVIHTYDDHRMAMSFSLLGLRAVGIEIADPDCVAKTFPRYWDVLNEAIGGVA